jgi:predicted dehydrogenase
MRVALIGLGMVSGMFADAIKKSDKVTLGPIFARREESRTAFLSAHPEMGAEAAASVDAIAADPSVDFVIVTTPPDARTEIVETLGKAGKPILMEKPIERDLAAATSIVETCEAYDTPLGITLQHRARPEIADFRQRQDTLGPLISVENNVPWWRPQTYYDEPGRGTYARDGGGVLITQAIHPIDLMLSLTGPVAEVTAMCATSGFHSMEGEDFVVAGMRFENGAIGQLFASTASYPGHGETLTLHCENGSARMDRGKLIIDWQDGRIEELGEMAASGSGADPMAFKSDWHRFVIEDFADALTDKRPPMITGRSALEVHRLIEAIEQSGRDGQRVTLN